MMRIMLVTLFVVGFVFSTPVEKVRRQAPGDVELLPTSDDSGDQFGMVPVDNPRFMPQFYDIFNQFSDMANMLRAWFNRPFFQPGDFEDDDFGTIGNLPPNYDNSTYSTKNINGSIITVNETIKKHASNDSSFVWHVKVVQIRPENATSHADDSPVGSISTTFETVETGKHIPDGDDQDNDVASVPRVRRSNTLNLDHSELAV